MKDALMADLYDSEKKLIVLDISNLSGFIESIEDSFGEAIDNTLLINSILPLVASRDMVDQVIADFLKREFIAINYQYENFSNKFRIEKLKSVSHSFQNIRNLSLCLRDILQNYKLYSVAGILTADTIEADCMYCSLASLGKAKWTENLTRHSTFSISSKNLEYLERILISH